MPDLYPVPRRMKTVVFLFFLPSPVNLVAFTLCLHGVTLGLISLSLPAVREGGGREETTAKAKGKKGPGSK